MKFQNQTLLCLTVSDLDFEAHPLTARTPKRKSILKIICKVIVIMRCNILQLYLAKW